MSLQLHLKRCSTEDIITIRKRRNSGYILRFVDTNFPHRVWIQDKTLNEIISYLEISLSGINCYKTLQLDIPSYPMINYNVQDIDDNIIQQIIHTINGFLLNPPSMFIQ
jgi:hypothetical protein